jgi:nucleotide-binding universal stress UspA family protein
MRYSRSTPTFLVPVDFSQPSNAALDAAVAMARADKARLVVVHVVSTAFMFPLKPGFAEIFTRLDKNARDSMAKLLRRKRLRPWRVLVLSGVNAADVIAATAKKCRATMIVMASHGKTGFDRWTLGSVAERTVRSAGCPVLIVKNRRARASNLLLVPFDFSRSAERALRHAIVLARGGAKRLAIVHIVPPVVNMSAVASAIRAAVEAIMRRHGFKRSDYQLLVLERPDAGRALANLARRLKASLIVMGSSGRSGVARMLLGSVAEKTLRYAECPVLIVKGARR